MKKHFQHLCATAFLTVIGGSFCAAQAPYFDWAYKMGGIGADYISETRIDGSGNIYSVGMFSGSVDFDHSSGDATLSSNGDLDIFIRKTDANGNLLWAKSIGGTMPDYGNALAVDASGNVFVAGNFQETVDFDPNAAAFNITSLGGNDVFVLKLDTDGNLVWVKRIGGTGEVIARDMALDNNGNVLVCGDYEGTVDFNPGSGTNNSTAAADQDAFVLKLDAVGDRLWHYVVGGSFTDRAIGCAIDANNNNYIVGNYRGTVDFNASSGTDNEVGAGGADAFILKIDNGGTYVFAHSFSGSSDEVAHKVAVDDTYLYITGRFKGTVDFNPTSGSATRTAVGDADVFVEKMTLAGGHQGCAAFGGSGYDAGSDILVDEDGNIYTIGNFVGVVDFDPSSAVNNISGNAANDFFVQKLDASFALVWAMAIGSSDIEYANSICFDAFDNLIVAGQFQTTVDFDHSITGTEVLTSSGDSDAFLMKLLQCDPSAVNTTVNQNGITLTATATGVSYQWVDCDNNNAAISGQTGQSFTPTINGNYAVIIDNNNGCSDMSTCFAITTVGLIPAHTTQTLVFPNPTTQHLYLQLPTDGMWNALLHDLTGKTLLSQTLQGNSSQSIELSNITPGVYFLHLTDNQGFREVIKVIKE